MALNRVIVTAGPEPMKKEKILAAPHSNPGEILENVVDDGIIKVTNATTDVKPNPLQIVDYGSTNGRGGPWKDSNQMEWNTDVYTEGDQIPLVYPIAGCEVNIMGAVNTAFAVGDYVTPNGNGQVKVTTDVSTAIGICLENIEASDVNKMVKVEVI